MAETRKECYFSETTGLYYEPDGTPFALPIPKIGAFKPIVDKDALLKRLVAEAIYNGTAISSNATWDDPLGQENK